MCVIITTHSHSPSATRSRPRPLLPASHVRAPLPTQTTPPQPRRFPPHLTDPKHPHPSRLRPLFSPCPVTNHHHASALSCLSASSTATGHSRPHSHVCAGRWWRGSAAAVGARVSVFVLLCIYMTALVATHSHTCIHNGVDLLHPPLTCTHTCAGTPHTRCPPPPLLLLPKHTLPPNHSLSSPAHASVPLVDVTAAVAAVTAASTSVRKTLPKSHRKWKKSPNPQSHNPLVSLGPKLQLRHQDHSVNCVRRGHCAPAMHVCQLHSRPRSAGEVGVCVKAFVQWVSYQVKPVQCIWVCHKIMHISGCDPSDLCTPGLTSVQQCLTQPSHCIAPHR